MRDIICVMLTRIKEALKDCDSGPSSVESQRTGRKAMRETRKGSAIERSRLALMRARTMVVTIRDCLIRTG